MVSYLKGLNYPSPESSINTHYNALLQEDLWMQWDSQIPMGRTEPKWGERTSGRRGLKLQGCHSNEKLYLEVVSTEYQCKPVVNNVIAGVVPKSWLFSSQLFVQMWKVGLLNVSPKTAVRIMLMQTQNWTLPGTQLTSRVIIMTITWKYSTCGSDF